MISLHNYALSFLERTRCSREISTLSAFILSLNMLDTHLAQTFLNRRTRILCPTLSLEIPIETEFFFATISAYHFFNAILMNLITCCHRPSTSGFVTQPACPNSLSLNRLTHRLTVLTSTSRSPQTACICL